MDNQSAILGEALKLFAARGYDAVGVQEIAESAGVTKPTLYHYFHSKRGLFDALLEQHFVPLVQVVEAAARYGGDLKLSLENVARAHFEFARHDAAFYRMQLSLWHAPRESEAHLAVAAWSEKNYRIVERLFAQAAEQHGNMKGRQRAYAATFLGMINTYIGLAFNGYATLDEPLVRQSVHQFMHGILS